MDAPQAKIFIFFPLLFFLICPMQAQGPKSWMESLEKSGRDSIYELRKKEFIEAQRAKDTLALAQWAKKLAVNQYQLLGDYQLAISTNGYAVRWAGIAGDLDFQSACLNNQGVFLMSIGRYDEAIGSYKKSLAISQQAKDSQSMAKGLHNLGNLYLNREAWPEARSSYRHAYAINTQIKNGTSARKNLLSLGVSYLKENRWDSAKHIFLKALDTNAPEDPVNKGLLYTHLGHVYNETNVADSSLFYFKEALALARYYKRTEDVLTARHAIGNWHFRQKEYEEAIQIWEEALDSLGNKNYNTTIYLYGGLAMAYKEVDEVEKSRAFYQKAIESSLRWRKVRDATTYRISLAKLEAREGNLNEAEALLKANTNQAWIKGDRYRYYKTRLELALLARKKGKMNGAKKELEDLIETAVEFKSWEDLVALYHSLADIAEQTGNYRQLKGYLSEKARWQDSIRASAYNENLANVRATYEHELQQAEIKKLEAEQELLHNKLEQGRQRRQFLLIILLTLGVGALVISWLLWRISRQSQRISSQRDQLSLSNKNKDRMFAIIAHDLSSPVHSFQDLNKLYQYHLKHDNRQALDDLSKEVSRQSSHLGKLLNNLLQWALQQLGTYKAELTRENLSEIVEEQVGLFQGRMKEKGLVPNLDLSPGIDWEGDIKGFRIALNNLLSNAVKFSEDASIRVLLGMQGGKVLLLVEDKGSGMDPNQVEAILKGQNYQSDKGSQGERGAGFGLQFVWQWLKQVDGTMLVESSPENGSCIGFLLPTNEHIGQHEST